MITHKFSKMIIYGAGYTAYSAYTFLGYGRIECFAVSDKSTKTDLYNKKIISYEEMIDLYRRKEDYLIVIAADKYFQEMEDNLRKDEISNYIVFHLRDVLGINDYLPFIDVFGKRIWKSYSEIMSHYDLAKYRKIYIYGVNEYIKYLHIELLAQKKDADVVYVKKIADRQEKELFFKSVEQDSVILINVRHSTDDIRHVIADLDNVETIDLYDVDKFQTIFLNRGLEKYKNIHAGERIFIIGNGPSLKVEDLNMLHENNVLSIAFNKIYKIFEKTEWRPTYIGITDPDIAEKLDYSKLGDIQVFQGDNIEHWEQGRAFENATKFHLINNDFSPNRPLFSEDICLGTYRGCTVAYDMGLQFAAYMGCKEIVLLGMDHSVVGKVYEKNNHFCDDYFDEEEENRFSEKGQRFHKDEMTLAYESAKFYANKHNINIYNATRGGKLEVFKRIDFDSLFV